MKNKILQRSPNNWSCLPTSFAMVLGVPVQKVVEICGHDGSDYYWSRKIPQPYGRRGFHIQEMIWVAHQLGYSVTPFEPRPVSKCLYEKGECEILFENQARRLQTIFKGDGVCTGLDGNMPHAIAFVNNRVYDPGYRIRKLQDFGIETFWRIEKLNQIK